MLPNFLVLGAPRCATTWIYHCLSEHPDIFVPEGKELRFFDEKYGQGLEWYQSQFEHYQGEKAVGEVATKYLSRPDVAERIHKDIPNAKLVVSLRDPVDRVYSAYGYDIKKGIHSLPFEKAVKQYYTEYVERGFYYDQIQQYLAYFSQSSLLVLIYEDIKKNPAIFIKNIYEFLEVDENFTPSQLNHRRNRGITRRDSTFLALIRLLNNTVLRVRELKKILDKFKETRMGNAILERTFSTHAKVDMNPETRAWLRALFQAQNESLSELLGRDLGKEWQ